MLTAVLRAALVDCVAMDVKAPLDERYARATGLADVDLRAVRRSLALLRDWDGDYELRTTVCPAVLSPEDVLDLAVDLVGVRRLVLQPFRPGHCLDPELNLTAPYPEELLLQLAERCQEFVGSASVRGRETAPSVPEG
jgi:pyruvate formate lyase activating enzyme